MYKIILALDPSGSFYEGKGTTGWCLYQAITDQFIASGSIFATDYTEMEAYWAAVLQLIEHTHKKYKEDLIIVCEDYILYANKAAAQTNSRMETPKFIGCLQLYCWMNELPYYMQLASEVKKRWDNPILEHKGYIKKRGRGYLPTSGSTATYTHHTLDAIRHAIHYKTFRNK